MSAGNRQQWVGFEGAPKTTVFGADGAIKLFDRFHGIGFSLLSDEAGAYQTLLMNLNYSYQIDLEEGVLGLGIKVGLTNQKFDGSRLNSSVGDQNDDYHRPDDPAIPQSALSGRAMDVGAGVYYSTPVWYAGVSCMHLNRPDPDFKEEFNWSLRPAVVVHGGYTWQLRNRKYAIEPRMLIKTDFSSWQADLQMSLIYLRRFWGTLGYRLQEAMLIQAGLELNNGLKIGYGYDINLNQMAGYHGGSHEIMLGYSFALSLEKRTKTYKSVRFL